MGCKGSKRQKRQAVLNRLLPPPHTIQHWLLGLGYPHLSDAAAEETLLWFFDIVSHSSVCQALAKQVAALLDSSHFVADMKEFGLHRLIELELTNKIDGCEEKKGKESVHIRGQCQRVLEAFGGTTAGDGHASHGPTQLWRNMAWEKNRESPHRRTKRYTSRSNFFGAAAAAKDERGSQNSLNELLPASSRGGKGKGKEKNKDTGKGKSCQSVQHVDAGTGHASHANTPAASRRPAMATAPHSHTQHSIAFSANLNLPSVSHYTASTPPPDFETDDEEEEEEDDTDDGPVLSPRPAEESELIVLACGRTRSSIHKVATHWKISLEDTIELMANVEAAQNGGKDVANALKGAREHEQTCGKKDPTKRGEQAAKETASAAAALSCIVAINPRLSPQLQADSAYGSIGTSTAIYDTTNHQVATPRSTLPSLPSFHAPSVRRHDGTHSWVSTTPPPRLPAPLQTTTQSKGASKPTPAIRRKQMGDARSQRGRGRLPSANARSTRSTCTALTFNDVSHPFFDITQPGIIGREHRVAGGSRKAHGSNASPSLRPQSSLVACT